MPIARQPKYFKSPGAFRDWLDNHHATNQELWVGFHKKLTGKPSLTWPESVDEALCYGWIDGIRRSVDEARYAIRFTPRKLGSHWSAINIRRARALIKEGRMQAAGLDAFNRRPASKSGQASYENRPANLPARYLARLRADKRAWSFYQAQPPWYRRASTWWIISAKQEETRLRRLSTLIERSARGQPVSPLTRRPKPK